MTKANTNELAQGDLPVEVVSEARLAETMGDYRGELEWLARSRMPEKLAGQVEPADLVQETFLAASEDFATFRGQTVDELRYWLRGILGHVIQNTRRHYEASKRAPIGKGRVDPDALFEGLAGSTTSAGSKAMHKERGLALVAAIAELPEHYRQVILWHNREALPFAEIGKRLGVAEGAAKMYWARALVKLRDRLGEGHDPR
jgi:RNA polymerase sigma-70 factor, ECF subfamily